MVHHEDEEEDKDKVVPDSVLDEVDEDDDAHLLADPLVAEVDADEERGGW